MFFITGMQLFPGVGRQRGGVYNAGSARGLSMPTHGFLSSCHTPLDVDTRHAVATATWSSGKDGCHVPGGADWPFDVRLAIRFAVRGSTLSVEYTVDAGPAVADGQLTLLSIGNHLSLAVPWAASGEGGPAPTLHLRAGPAARGSPVGVPLLPGAQVERVGELPSWLRPPSEGRGERGGCPATDEAGGLDAVAAFGDPFAPSTPEDSTVSVDGALCEAVVGEVHVKGAGEDGSLCATVRHFCPTILKPAATGASDSEYAIDAARSLDIARGCAFVFWGRKAGDESGVGFLCPEPWVGLPDSLNSGIGCARLAAGERLCWRWDLCVCDARTAGP